MKNMMIRVVRWALTLIAEQIAWGLKVAIRGAIILAVVRAYPDLAWVIPLC
ncbi:TPA: hypothetical protein P2K96_002707 [Aeromonas salmonicida]|uniref:Uncharacterized protein n=1 Tax=Aeromonas caviae TaxID=648 RepID=A0A7D5YFF6_AERCA|nr:MULTISPECIES: hypothetical protein [Aeromonas]QLI60349.1 hypothetical protein C1C91_23185 [Aeromonas caviae]QLI60364.1 hypothetical protein C1C91_22235 [Aeromonas caviae]HDN9423312.1 hypothetical protein [Aeromonas salmonicida]